MTVIIMEVGLQLWRL
jgi:hypothetical protein